MKKFKCIIAFLTFALLLTGCVNKEYELNKETTLTGKVTTNEITKDNETYKVSILTLDKPIVIDGTKIHKIELDYDKKLKDNQEITIKGVIQNNKSTNSLEYSLKVSDVDDILSFVNTFSNDDFSMTIPTELIKLCSIEEIDNGYTISITSDDKKNEVFRIISLTNKEFKELDQDDNIYFEKITSNRKNYHNYLSN